ncbi:MAG: LLM class flavin-dependent oxidoreductase [Acidimicrobiaceae bacterium]|nr:LLM class flavin-dependent oxidoreductase [Acidimicrobiaceae bacterium]
MPDAGSAGPATVDRRYGIDDYLACYHNLLHLAKRSDELGFDTMWFTEHHFQYEGYEVIPNQVLLGMYYATQTERIRFGQMFNIVPQWHPLRLAEDFAMADLLTGGRMVFGVGRGTVPREAESLGAVVASGDNEMSVELDRQNREVFEEGMEVILSAWENERFSFTGKHFTFPPTGIPDRGATVSTLTLVPRPKRKIEVYQAATSPPSVDYVAKRGFNGVFAAAPLGRLKRSWDRFGEAAAEAGRVLAPGEARSLVVNIHIGETREEAFATGRDGHDEYVKFLSPYGRFRHYLPPAGLTDTPFAYRPTIEESTGQKVWAIGSPDDVAEILWHYAESLSLRHLICYFEFPGLTTEALDRQLTLFTEAVAPLLGVQMDRR